MTRQRLAWLLGFAVVLPIATGFGQRAPSGPAAEVTIRVVSLANAFLGTLAERDRDKGMFDFNSPQKAGGWSNLPSGIFQRHGWRLGDLTAKQREAALAVVAATLSREGFQKVTDIMNGDEVLKNMGGGRTGGRQAAPAAPAPGRQGQPGAGGRGGGGRGGGVQFGKDEYYLAFLGPPSTTAPWMLQFGGHHLAINVTLVGPNNVMTPSLPAAQPAKYTLDGQSIRPLGKENDKAFALINALDASQKSRAILTYQVNDLVLGPGNDGKVIQPEGIPASALNADQQAMLLDLAHEWVGILNNEAAADKMVDLKANIANTWFAWSGATTNGGLAYFRIQGPTVVIEYAPQQGDLDHIHTIYRDPTNDYGARLVKP
jgi:hypothetical protein